MRTILGALALLAAAVATAGAQVGRVTGTVTDGGTGEPVEGVQVYLSGTGYGAVTQPNGRYFIINIPPGEYTVIARRVGYQEQRVQNVRVLIDVARELNFQISSAAATLSAVRVEAREAPLITPGITGSHDAISAEELAALPVQDIRGALQLQAGFLAVPENTDVLTYYDIRRGLTPLNIRGGRGSETLTLIDGIPVNNFLFGGSALDITPDAVQQIDYVRGGFEPQYGNALSGIVNIAVREGTTDLRGSVEVQSSGVGGAIGSDYDDLRDFQQVQGYISGSVPATQTRLRYMFSGRLKGGAARVLEFDDRVFNPRNDERDPNNNFDSNKDLFPGFRAFGFDHQRDLIAKSSFYFTPLSKLNLTVIDYQRQSQPYVFDWIQAGFDAYAQCVRLYPDMEETCSSYYNAGREINDIDDLNLTNNEEWYVRQASVNQQRRLYVGSLSHTVGRLALNASIGQFDQSRSTCTFVTGVCLGTRIAYTYFNGPFVATGRRSRNEGVPLYGTDEIFGGDELRTRVARADLTWQATDHHNLQGGVFYQGHEVTFGEWRDQGLNRVDLIRSAFSAKPWDAAFYLQDRIEYDFLTLKLGARFDYGRAPGRFFADPRDPTNGTTAENVCREPAAWGVDPNRFTAVDRTGATVTGLAACSAADSLMQFAAGIAAEDDFAQSPARKHFSPRVGLQFPLSQSSSVFFNFGKYAQNPTMYNLYSGTGVGLRKENCDPAADETRCVLEGTPGAVSLTRLSSGGAPIIGNPQLETETTTSYEIGYAIEFLRNYAFKATAWSKDQTGLTGLGRGGVRRDGTIVSDIGATYGAITPDYRILENRDFQTARGIETSFRRRVANFWGFDLNYSYARVLQSADPPELEAEKQIEGEPQAVQQFRSGVDQPHVLNATLRFAADERTPPVPYIGRFLRHTALTTTLRIASGLPYTPSFDFGGGTLGQRNSGTAPTTFNVDLFASKDFTVGNVRLGGFMRVSNLLDRDNCLQAFSSTGQCISGSPNLGTLEKGRVGAGFGQTSTFSQAYDRPDYRYPPRAVSGGLRVTF